MKRIIKLNYGTKKKVYCEDCKHWNTVPSEIGLGCECMLCELIESPISKFDIKRNFSSGIDNKDNHCRGYRPNAFKKFRDYIEKMKQSLLFK